MPGDSALRFGLMALQMRFISRKQFLGAAEVLLREREQAGAPGQSARSPAEVHLALGFLGAEQADTITEALEADAKGPAGIDSELKQALLELRPQPAEVAWLHRLGERQAAFRLVPRDERFQILGEIARGGLGQVLEATDRQLRREVAVKVVLDGMTPDVSERFVREAQITARLDHPNIVPVYDFDELPAADAGRKLVLLMKRIRGRDLGTLLGALQRGQESAAQWTRARLLSVFQGICLGVAYAHSKGVIHRDLKPANVMIGDFGEVLIVDWGLAKEQGEVSGEAKVEAPPAAQHGLAADLTFAGDVVGTPAYMSPEQAAGRISEVDSRSDIYALGGILFAILAHRSPYAGKTKDEVIRSVLSGHVPSPSRVVAAAHSFEVTAHVRLPELVPPELESICLKALAPRREDRYGSARELHDEIQLFLEGVKERERNHRLAEEAAAKAKAAMERQRRLKEEARVAAEEAKKAEKGVHPWDADKSRLWAVQDRTKALEREGVEAFAEANAKLTQALGYESDHAEARRLKAELFWRKYLEAEEHGDEAEMLLHRSVVEQHNDGPLDALLKGDGTLTVRTREYRCRCLVEGRIVKPGEPAWIGYHPFSGRALDGHRGAEGLPELEPAEPVRLRVHGPGCAPSGVEGAGVWLFRYEEAGRRLMPVTPDLDEAKADNPAAPPLDGLFAPDSPYRPQGPGVWLGRTPIEKRALPMGSWLLVVEREGRVPMRVPVSIPRCGHAEQEVTLFHPDELPAGFVPIPAGPFGFQGDPENPFAGPAETKVIDDIFIARHPVTCREYCEFLNDLAKTDSKQAARRVPRQAEESGFYWPGPPFAVPTSAWLAAAPSGLRAKAKKLHHGLVDWEEDWPVFGISWEDGMAYAAWMRGREARATILTHELEWEKAARGTDRRAFPWGRHWDDRWANGNKSKPGDPRPVSVRAFPDDESPYGVRGLGGNSRDTCLNDPGPEHPGWRLFRGGSWSDMGILCRAVHRTGHSTRGVFYYGGFRLSCVVRFARTP
ncbi:MAG: bifunctional serine/threonine-protein kinase/formylglycine-generating enzyme family protein [Planctomycetota bacterium]|mgnify:CR=1 FL=1